MCLVAQGLSEESLKTDSSTAERSFKFLVVSDIHCCTAGALSRGVDTPSDLLDQMLEAMHTKLPELAAVIVPGDLTVHGNSEGASRSRVFREVVVRLKKAFENKPILIALGNNDTDQGDYQFSKSFLAETKDAVCGALGRSVQSDCQQTYPLNGTYRATLSLGKIDNQERKVEMLIANTNPIATRCGKEPDPGYKEKRCTWRGAPHPSPSPDRGLAAPVIIVGHVPPGWDDYRKEEFLGDRREFENWLSANARGTSFAIFGHAHRTELRALTWNPEQKNSDEQTTRMLLLMAPSVSPIYNNNPGFLILTLNARMQLTDYRAYYMGLKTTLDERGNRTAGICEARSFAEEYPSVVDNKPVAAHTVERLRERLSSDRSELTKYVLARCNYATNCDGGNVTDTEIVEHMIVQAAN